MLNVFNAKKRISHYLIENDGKFWTSSKWGEAEKAKVYGDYKEAKSVAKGIGGVVETRYTYYP